MPSGALPDNPFSECSTAYTAYKKCLLAESTYAEKLGAIELIGPRIIGHLLFLIHSSGRSKALKVFAEEVNSSTDDVAIVELGKLYNRAFVNVFKRPTDRKSRSSDHSSLQEDVAENANYTDRARNGSLDLHASKRYALERDNNRCLLTHKTHTEWALSHLDQYDGCGNDSTDAAHIIPTCVTHWIPEKNKGSEKHIVDRDIWRILNTFAGRPVFDELNGNSVHRLENVLTVANSVCERFYRMQLWLKAVPGESHKYHVVTSHAILHEDIDDIVEFKTTNDMLPRPDARYLELHALACEVAHMSGATEFINKLDSDLEEAHVLSHDGSSGDLLDRVLTLIAPAR